MPPIVERVIVSKAGRQAFWHEFRTSPPLTRLMLGAVFAVVALSIAGISIGLVLPALPGIAGALIGYRIIRRVALSLKK